MLVAPEPVAVLVSVVIVEFRPAPPNPPPRGSPVALGTPGAPVALAFGPPPPPVPVGIPDTPPVGVLAEDSIGRGSETSVGSVVSPLGWVVNSTSVERERREVS